MAFEPTRLYSGLLNTGLQNKDNPLYQVIRSLIDGLNTVSKQTSTIIATPSITNITQQLIQGLQGDDGIDGDSGLPGIIGLTGLTGPQGVPGIDGDIFDDSFYRPNPGIQDLISNFTSGSVLFVGPSGFLAQDNTNFNYDVTNNRLGIGVAVPLSKLHIVDGVFFLRAGLSVGLQVKTSGSAGWANFGGTDGTIVAFYDNSNVARAHMNGSGQFVGQVKAGNTFILDSAGLYFGQIGNLDAHTWTIGYGSSGSSTSGTAVIFWNDSGQVGIGVSPTALFSVNEKFQIDTNGLILKYKNILTIGWGVPSVYGLDNRTGLTAADGAATTLYTTIAANNLFRISADIFATAAVTGTATYTIKWTENSTAQTMAVTSTAINTLGTASNLIRPDNGTTITSQLTGVFTGTFTVAGLVEQVA